MARFFFFFFFLSLDGMKFFGIIWSSMPKRGYVVILGSHSYSCGKWDRTRIPCQHALLSLAFQGSNPLDYVCDWYKKKIYLKPYEFPINPPRCREFWLTSEEG
ncbi:Zinc finger PMZ-type protein [Dioscorea alata]|uniref:Zinc finger PMZ-type protein n=1 Tax=Dioscorea alata TaxID=55571 RepID=A0ACB7WQM9_DIOAL|nr:Zinc finger PMZ-type protein [Dioscorea alata]